MAKIEYTLATGRRKNAVARVRMTPGDGKFLINGRTVLDYLKKEVLKLVIEQPLQVTSNIGKYDIFVNVKGGGISGQAGAIRHGIARALDKLDSQNRPALKSNGYLTRDSRMVERKKYGQPGARKKFQFSKR
ncbi:MAG: 30S ribosomal protein S9 [Spirochaetes bacterium]|nr:30S ribosomal protein S9 [Spirochaetota bacterium]